MLAPLTDSSIRTSYLLLSDVAGANTAVLFIVVKLIKPNLFGLNVN